MAKYSFLGPQGTFTHEVASMLFQDHEAEPRFSNKAVIDAVANGEVDFGIAPVENSIDGAVTETVDTILQHHNLWITSEITRPILHNLIGYPTTDFSKVRRVLSHPSALRQCQKWISNNLPGAVCEETTSTAGAVRRLGEMGQDDTCVAIGNAKAVDYEPAVEVLVEGIQGSAKNTTRFVTVSQEPAERNEGVYKTSIVFSAERDVPGSLYDALTVFKAFHINMSKIESRPKKESLGDYLFLVDFLGSSDGEMERKALELFQSWVTEYRLLGSYPCYAV